MIESQETADTETAKTGKKKGTGKQIVLVGIWLALLAGVIVWVKISSQPPSPNPPVPPIPILDPNTLGAQWPEIAAHAAASPRGQANTPYTIAEFGDFQCPQCGKIRPMMETLLKKYPAQVNLIFLHRPFPSIHEWALPAGQAAEIAAAHGKFWPMYDVLYAHQEQLEPGYYGEYAAQAGLDRAQFQAAFDAGDGKQQIADATRFADSLGIQRTPWLLVHDNAAKTVKMYVGLDTKKNAEAGIPYTGINDLVQRPPWVK